MEKVLLSVIIPAYNAETTIQRTLDSVLKVESELIEVIIVNDGSTDCTSKICKQFCERDTRVVLVNKKNEGVSAARNAGIKKARGEYILFLDADDELILQAYKQIIDNLNIYQEDFIIFAYMIERKNGKNPRIVNPFKEGAITKDRFYACIIQSTFMNFCWGKLYKREFLEKSTVQFDMKLKMGEDLKFQIDLMEYSPTILYCKEPLVLYYQAETSVTHRYSCDRFKDLIVDYNIRMQLREKISEQEVDLQIMYFDLGRNLLSYIKNVSKNGKYNQTTKEIKAYLKKKEIKDIIVNFPLGKAGIKMDVVAIMLKMHMSRWAISILRII